MNKLEKKKLFKKAIKETIKRYEDGEPFQEMNSNSVCLLSQCSTTLNCYRCPLNCTTNSANKDFGCMARRNFDVTERDDPNFKRNIRKAISFHESVIKILDSGVNPYDADSFHSKTRSVFAYYIRAIDLII